MMDKFIFQANDALLTANGYVAAAQLILQALQLEKHGRKIDDALHALQLVVNGSGDMINEALGDLEDIDIAGSRAIGKLEALIGEYQKAKQAWEKQFDENEKLSEDSAEWHTYMNLTCQIIDFKCSSMAEINRRAKFMLADGNLVDTLANCATDAAAVDFLKSMAAGPSPVDIGEEKPNGQP